MNFRLYLFLRSHISLPNLRLLPNTVVYVCILLKSVRTLILFRKKGCVAHPRYDFVINTIFLCYLVSDFKKFLALKGEREREKIHFLDEEI